MVPLDRNSLIVFALIVVLAPLAAAVYALLFPNRPRALGYLTIGFSSISLLASIVVASGPGSELPLQFSFFYLDELSIYFMLLVNLVAFVASWYTARFLDFDARHNRAHHDPFQFHLFFNLFHVTMLIVPMMDNLVVLWMAVELTTVFSTILVRYRKDRPALEAAWKFIVITTTGIIFALLGTLFLVNAIPLETQKVLADQNLDPMSWSVLARRDVAGTLARPFVELSFLFVLIGYGTKAGLAPMHTWLPDGHGEAPSPVSALLSGVMLKSALYAILRFYTITNLNQGDSRLTSTILLVSGLLSLTLATPFILKHNKKFKRVLAYHSLEHMGIITFGIGIGSPVALFGALLHALNHALTKALMFLIFGYIQHEYDDRLTGGEVDLDDDARIRGVWKSMPITGTLLAGGGLALVGSPPFNIFMSEFIILWAAVEKAIKPVDPLILLAVSLFLITVTLIFIGLVGHLSRLLLDRPPAPLNNPKLRIESLVALMPSLVLMGLILLFGLLVPTWPVDFPRLLGESTRILQQGPSR